MTTKALNREILRLSLPSILANITVPLVGMVDTALAGHLRGGESAACIGGISVGALLLNLLYWNFFFLRTGTGGLTAQAYGRGDMRSSALIFARGLSLSLIVSVLILVLQRPLVHLGLLLVGDATPRVCELALRYFNIRIWAVPATLGLMVYRGWFVGMQDSVSSMWTDLVINLINVVASFILCFGIGGWQGMGFDGIPTGTVIAQYSGLVYVNIVCSLKYGRRVFSTLKASDLREIVRPDSMVPYMKMNVNLLGRSLCFTVIYMGYTVIAAGFGDMLLACSSIMMQLLMLFSYFTDGFAYAGEALSGRFIGARDEKMLRQTVRLVFIWSMAIAVGFTGFYAALGTTAMGLFSSDADVVQTCSRFLPWLLVMPPLGCAAFTWDGIFLGATESRSLFFAMLGAMLSFLGVWIAFSERVGQGSDACLHLLLAAYFAHLAFRTLYLSLCYKACIVIR